MNKKTRKSVKKRDSKTDNTSKTAAESKNGSATKTVAASKNGKAKKVGSVKKKSKIEAVETRTHWMRREFGGLSLLIVSLIILISLFTYSPKDPSLNSTGSGAVSNLIGRGGAFLADFSLNGFGYSAYLFGILIGVTGIMLLVRQSLAVRIKESAGYLLLLLFTSVLLALLLEQNSSSYPPGGLVGGWLSHAISPVLGKIGLGLICFLGWLYALALATNQSPVAFFVLLSKHIAKASKQLYILTLKALVLSGKAFARAFAALGSSIKALLAKRSEKKALKQAEREQQAKEEEANAAPAINKPMSETEKETVEELPEAKSGEAVVTIRRKVVVEEPKEEENKQEKEKPEDVLPIVNGIDKSSQATDVSSDEIAQNDEDEDPDAEAQIVDSRAPRVNPDDLGDEALEEVEEEYAYELPPLRLLDFKHDGDQEIDREQLFSNARKLEETLLDYGIHGKVKEIHPGPVVTMYEFAPARGTKLSRIANLEDDLAMALAAFKVRIVAPIPGKSVVGIEVPSQNRETVYFKEIVGHKKFYDSKNKLTIALGKDIFGYPVVANLQKMPHLLIAGATGSGKSVGVNTMILSILFRCSPEEVKFILVDPKRLEFNFYEGIPHLLLPVVTDPKQASLALGWVVHEMDTRYQQLSEWGAKNIDSYNNLVSRLEDARERKGGDIQQVIEEFSLKEGGDGKKLAKLLRANPVPKRMPFIVVVIDELADLMMVAGKEVELSIARLAQLARASGIHLIVATQRPSTDVLTGLIKNNFPARISFRVSQKVDSRTILDQNGAEALLGMGDMLFAPGTGELKRIHGAFITEEETSRIVEFIKRQRRFSYQTDILDKIEKEAEIKKQVSEEYDSEYDKAVEIVCSSGKASISLLQRKLKIGYNRSARIIEKMEEDGLVGPSDGVRGRQVYARPIPKD